MADSFGIPQLVDYLTNMGLCIANVDQEQEIDGSNGEIKVTQAISETITPLN
jgi:hypothetical protein